MSSMSEKEKKSLKWALWYQNGRYTNGADWEAGLKRKASFNTVDEIINDCKHVRRLREKQALFVFREGIAPVWRNEKNCNGGRWKAFYHVWDDVEMDEIDKNFWKLVNAIVVLGDQHFGVNNTDHIVGVAVRHPKSEWRDLRCIDLWVDQSEEPHHSAIVAIGRTMANLLDERITFNSHMDFKNEDGRCSRLSVRPRLIAEPETTSESEETMMTAASGKKSSLPTNVVD